MTGEAVFSLYARRLPATRNYLVACGLDEALAYLEHMRFTQESVDYLASLDTFSDEFLQWLSTFRFSGDVYAVAEGTPIFGLEPLLEVVAPLPEAQLAETYLMNQCHLQTLAASKASRVVQTAQSRPVIDFGARRMHGTDAAIKAARAFYIAGVQATSNVLAGKAYGIPVTGTMAHSYIQAHEDEQHALQTFLRQYPGTVLLVDTYNPVRAVRQLITLYHDMGDDFSLKGIRLDSGDIAADAHAIRVLLDDAGLTDVRIFVSGGLDERGIQALLKEKAPIDGFGVGTRMGVSDDAPCFDIVYKLVAYNGRPTMKAASGKVTLPGKKQVFRTVENGSFVKDTIAVFGEQLEGTPLLTRVMQSGTRLSCPELAAIAKHHAASLQKLPPQLRGLEPADYPVEISPALQNETDTLLLQIQK